MADNFYYKKYIREYRRRHPKKVKEWNRRQYLRRKAEGLTKRKKG